MAIAGSPLPHAKANPFALPAVVSNNSRGQAVPLGTTDRQVTDLTLCGSVLPQFDRTLLSSFYNHQKKHKNVHSFHIAHLPSRIIASFGL